MKYPFFKSPLFFICLVLVCSSAVYSDGQLETKTFFNDHLEIKIPAGFNVTNDDIVREEGSENIMSRLICAGPYTVPAFTITQYKSSICQDSIGIELESLASQYKKDPSVKWIGSGVKLINGHKVGYMEYVLYDDNYMLDFFTDVDGRYVAFRFICLTEQKKWVSASKEIMLSLKVK